MEKIINKKLGSCINKLEILKLKIPEHIQSCKKCQNLKIIPDECIFLIIDHIIKIHNVVNNINI